MSNTIDSTAIENIQKIDVQLQVISRSAAHGGAVAAITFQRMRLLVDQGFVKCWHRSRGSSTVIVK